MFLRQILYLHQIILIGAAFGYVPSISLRMLEVPNWVLFQTVKTQLKYSAAFYQGLHGLLRYNQSAKVLKGVSMR